TPYNSPVPLTPPSPTPLSSSNTDATDLIFSRAVDKLNEVCRQRLLRPAADFVNETRRINNEARKQQATDTSTYNSHRQRYKRVAKNPQDLVTMLTMIDKQAASATERNTSRSNRCKAAARVILHRATDIVNDYRASRLISLRAELDTRLAKAEVSRRLQESHRIQHHVVVTRLQEYHRTQHRAEVTRLRESHRTQHPTVVTRLKKHRSALTCHKKGFDTTAIFPLQKKYQALAPAIPATPTVQIGPLCLSPAEAAAMRAVQETLTNNINPRILYSDGSLLHSGMEDVSQAFAVVDLTQEPTLTVQGRSDGYASSAKAELMGLLAAVLAAPPDQDIVIRLDNESVVTQFRSLVKERSGTLPRKRFRNTYAGLWAVLYQVVDTRPGKVEVEWIKGHSNILGNELADQAAKGAAQSNTAPW
ncbi:hypothetical protein BGZ95_007588, partial [Linnemannia exigua]